MMDDATLKTVTARILYESMTAEDREKMLTNAIASLLTERASTNYNDQRTKFQRVFDDALATHASQLVHEHLRTPEVHAKLQEVIAQACGKVFAADAFVEGLASKISAGLWSDR